MENANLVYFAIILISALLFALAGAQIHRKMQATPGVLYIMLFFAAAFLFVFLYVMYTYEPVVSDALNWYRFIYPVDSFVMMLLLLFALASANPFYKLGRGMVVLTMIIPAATLLITILGDKTTLMFTTLDIFRIFPKKTVEYSYGLWFYVNTAYCYFAQVLAATLFYQVCRNSSQSGRWQAQLFIIGIGMFFFFDVVSVFGGFEPETNLIGLCLMCFIFYYACVRLKASDLAFLAKDAAFEKLSSAAIIFEDSGDILFCNTVAKSLFSFREGRLEGCSYNRLISDWLENKHGEFTENGVEGEEGLVIVKIRDNTDKYYEIIKSEVMNKVGRKLGEFVEIRDVTTQQELIAELYRMVNFDQLTGLFNRRYFNKMCEKYSGEEHLPLAFVVGDLNKLKVTNDNYGHAYGDKLLVLIASILKKLAPENAILSRHSGDEFFIMIPNCGEEAVKKYLEDVREYCQNYRHEPPFDHPEISLGYAVKTDCAKNNDVFLIEADLSMYKVKKNLYTDVREDSRAYGQLWRSGGK